MSWKKVLGAVAPTLARALGGPLAGMAVREITEKVLGVPKATEKEIEEALVHASPEMLLKLKEADQAFEARMAELGVDLEKIDAGDRADARARQIATHDWTPNVLSVVILSGFFVVQWYVLQHALPAGTGDLAARTLGTLDMMTGAVVFYFFGSSSGSRAKDDTISRAAGQK